MENKNSIKLPGWAKQNKKHLILFATLLFVFLLGTGFGSFVMPYSLGNSEVTEIEADIQIDYGEGNVQSFREEIFWQGASALETLKALERRHGIALEIRELSGKEVLVEGINGIRNSRNSFWQFQVNGEAVETKAEDYILKNGDSILWRRIQN